MSASRSETNIVGLLAMMAKSVDRAQSVEADTRAINANVGSGDERTCFW